MSVSVTLTVDQISQVETGWNKKLSVDLEFGNQHQLEEAIVELMDALSDHEKRKLMQKLLGDKPEFEFPEYHASGMGCGLEDRGITDRYQAMEFGWDRAIQKTQEQLEGWIDEYVIG